MNDYNLYNFKFKKKKVNCKKCGKEFTKTSPNSKYCPECSGRSKYFGKPLKEDS